MRDERWMLEIIGKTNIDFLGVRRVTFALSGTLVLVGLFALIQIGRGAANLSIDFSGGASVQVKFDKPIEIDRARHALKRAGLPNAELQEFIGGDRLLVRVKSSTSVEEKVTERIIPALRDAFPDHQIMVDSTTEIGPTIGEQLRKDALLAVVISLAGIVLYISARFEFRFGIAAALAMMHDVLVVLGFFYLLNKEITLLVVTALLTLAGYSLTDKVVVFDRIRENLRSRRREGMEVIINNSINQVMSRTIVTSLTVVLVLVPLALIGGEVLHDFSVALLWGVVIGTYSSVFIASPLLMVLPGRKASMMAGALARKGTG
ncbi:MAG: protein translocase subunit SecF [Nitrospiraceae bacterium]